MIAFFREVYAAYLAAFRANDIQAIDELVQYPLAYIGPALTRTPSGWRLFAVSDITVPT